MQILLNSLDFWSSKTITSILLLSLVLLKPIHAMTFGTKFLLFVSICVPPNNPITACGATSFPGYHSFPKWAHSRHVRGAGSQLSQLSQALFGVVRTWMSDQLRIPRVVITSFFSFPFEGDIKDCRTHQPCVMSFFQFLSYSFLISPCPHSRVYLQYRTIVQINSQTRRSNSSQFS